MADLKPFRLIANLDKLHADIDSELRLLDYFETVTETLANQSAVVAGLAGKVLRGEPVDRQSLEETIATAEQMEGGCAQVLNDLRRRRTTLQSRKGDTSPDTPAD